MRIKISSLSKNEDFKSLLKGKKINNKYLTIFYKKLGKSNKSLSLSWVAKKKLGNAPQRNRIKRRLRHIVNDAIKNIDINLNYSYLLISKSSLLKDEYKKIKEMIFKEFESIK